MRLVLISPVFKSVILIEGDDSDFQTLIKNYLIELDITKEWFLHFYGDFEVYIKKENYLTYYGIVKQHLLT